MFIHFFFNIYNILSCAVIFFNQLKRYFLHKLKVSIKQKKREKEGCQNKVNKTILEYPLVYLLDICIHDYQNRETFKDKHNY